MRQRPISRARREELKREAEAMFIPEDAENPFAEIVRKYGDVYPDGRTTPKPKLPCHVPNCTSPECDRFHPGDNE